MPFLQAKVLTILPWSSTTTEDPLSNVSVGPSGTDSVEVHIVKHEHNLLSKSIVEATCEPEDSVHWIAHAAESAVVSVDAVAAVDPEQVVPSIGEST